jgi:crotonobetainyl-CoA:carnitine CoA-transferase CaiB-like acyl-CoA transferase
MARPVRSDRRRDAASNSKPCALAGRRVLELADAAGAYCGKLLADMGADVVKIEPPEGDAARLRPPFWRDQPGPEHSLFHLYMNAGKRGVTLGLATRAGQDAVRRLARTADLVVETFPPGYLASLGLGYEALRAAHPRLVLTSITGFGQTGPQRAWASSDLVASALGGALHVTGYDDDPPVALAGTQAYVMASAYAAVGSMIALHHAARTGEGQHVDVSMEETTASVTHICGVGKWLDDGIVPRRGGPGLFASVPSGAYRCTDGLVYLMVNRPLHWKALAAWVHEVTGNQEVLDPMFEGPSSNRIPYRELLDLLIAELTARLTVAEAYHEGQRRHIAFTPVSDAAAVARDPHLAARGYFIALEHPRLGTLRMPGAPYRHGRTPWRVARPAPALGEHDDEIFRGELGLSEAELRALRGPESGARAASAESPAGGARRAVSSPAGATAGGVLPAAGASAETTAGGVLGAAASSADLARGSSSDTSTPDAPRDACAPARPPAAPTPQALAGVRVLELTSAMAGPWVGRFMAYCGAEVIRVESHQRPDVVRLYVPPRAPEMGTQPELSPWFTDWNAGKRFVALDLTRPAGVELVRRLVATCDVVVENQTAGVMEKLGLGYAALTAARPDVVMLSTSGYGDSGPCTRYVTWGPNIEALAGLATLSGFPGRDCTITQYAYPDVVSALHGLFAVLCALEHRRRSGEGQYVNLAQYEATVAVLGPALMEQMVNGHTPRPLGNRALHAAPHGCYRCRGDDAWCAITVESERAWHALCRMAGAPEWARDPRFATRDARLAHADELDRLLEAWTTRHPPYDVMRTLQAAGVAAGVVQNVEDLMRRDRQLAARGFFEEIVHLRKGTVTATGIPLGLTATPGRSGRSGAAVGEDNDYVFRELLGLSAEEIRRYVEAGAIEARRR